MPVYALDQSLWFPPATEYEEHGIVAIGGDVSTERLLEAYKQGIFPWYNEDEPITWWSPAKRMVLKPEEVNISKSMRRLINKEQYTLRCDTCFEKVIDKCQHIKRKGQAGTWLNDALKENMIALHGMGYAHSIEVFEGKDLVGGLYGISIGGFFCGDSMFSEKSNTSKLAFIGLCTTLASKGFTLIDCQVHNNHLESLGAYEIPRDAFLDLTANNLKQPTLRGPWTDWFQ
jgi:leucyl/phenylalanyl-tRNA--protein transferase